VVTSFPGAFSTDALLQQALAHYQAGRLAEAENLYRQVLVLRPDMAEAQANFSLMLLLQGKSAEAITALRRALEMNPDNIDALYKLGNLLLREGPPGDNRIEESFACFLRHARLTFERGGGVPMGEARLAHRLKHDQEQQDYLAQNFGIRDWKFHLADGSRIEGAAVNPAPVKDAVEQWNTRTPQIIVIDDLLTQEALEKLRRYCWGSTVWRVTHPEGYLTAMPEHGLVCPLIAQIDEEMRAIYPGILGRHLLRYLWAFKYDSKLSGVGTHADPSLVTFNFWITADEANLDPEHGGLTVWDVGAPEVWKAQRYIADTAGCQAYLKNAGAKSVTIPYRSNRAVVFASHLFHETDRMDFREGYTNRRINITMLYGRR
jgi:Tetratricopeptide repeat